MHRLVMSVDPGTRAVGVCVWMSGRLLVAKCSIADGKGSLNAMINHHLSELMTWTSHKPEAVIELMRHRANSPAPPNDLIDVGTIGAAIAGACHGPVHMYPATEWKGSVPKEIHHKRIQQVLSPREVKALEAGLTCTPKRHHKEILDALGLGLFHLKRTKRSGAERDIL